MSLNFLSSGEGLDWFSWPNFLSKLSKNKPKSQLGHAQSRNMTINFELLTVSKMTSLKIYKSLVMEKAETSNFDIR